MLNVFQSAWGERLNLLKCLQRLYFLEGNKNYFAFTWSSKTYPNVKQNHNKQLYKW